MKRIKVVSLLAAVCLLISVASGCGTQPTQQTQNTPAQSENNVQTPAATPEAPKTEAPKSDLKLAVIYSDSGLGDGSFNDNTALGVKRVEQELGIKVDYAEPKSQSEYESLMVSFAQAKEYAAILCVGFSQGTSLDKVAAMFPDQKFMILDTKVEQPNVASFEYRSEEAAYMAGVAAALATKEKSLKLANDKNIIGFVGAMDIPIIQVFKQGFENGAKSVNPDVEVLSSYVGDWSDPAKAKELAIAEFQKGADVIYQVSSMGGLGVIEAAKSSGFYCIGQDDNQNGLAPDNMILSVLKRLDNTVFNAVKDLAAGNFHAGSNVWGLKEGAVDITYEKSNVVIPDAIKAKAEEARQEILKK